MVFLMIWKEKEGLTLLNWWEIQWFRKRGGQNGDRELLWLQHNQSSQIFLAPVTDVSESSRMKTGSWERKKCDISGLFAVSCAGATKKYIVHMEKQCREAVSFFSHMDTFMPCSEYCTNGLSCNKDIQWGIAFFLTYLCSHHLLCVSQALHYILQGKN